MVSSIENQLKELIKAEYGDVKAFSIVVGIPNSTIHSMFVRGILKSSISNVIQISRTLGISVDALIEGRVEKKVSCSSINKIQDPNLSYIIECYNEMNQDGKKQLVDVTRAFKESGMYDKHSNIPLAVNEKIPQR